MMGRVGRLSMIVVAAIAACAGPSVAAPGEPASSDADACQPDIHRLCDRFFPDPALVATCLVDRRAELSTACAEVLARPEDGAADPKIADPKTAEPKTAEPKTAEPRPSAPEPSDCKTSKAPGQPAC